MKLSEYLKKNNMTTEEYFERQKRRSKGVTTLTDYRRDKKNSLSQTIGFDTFEADLNSMGTTIQGIYDGWQTQDTMSKTKTTVEAMQARINAYQEYQKMFGGADLSEISNSYKSVLEGWDDLTYHYSKYKTADKYKKAVADAEKAAKEKEEMKTADTRRLKGELMALEKDLETVRNKQDALTAYKNSGVAGSGTPEEKKLKEEISSILNRYGYSSFDDLEGAHSEKQKFYNNAKRIQAGIALSGVNDPDSKNYDPDFDKYVSKGDALKTKRNAWYESGYKNQIGYLRDNPEMIETYEDISEENGAMIESVLSNQLPYLAAKYMTDDEYNLYSYYLGKGDEESAEKYLSSIAENFTTKQGTDIAAERDSLLSKYTFGYKAGIDQFTQGTINLFNTEDNYIPSTGIQNASSQLREDIDKEHGTFGQGVYDLITTTSNMAPSILASAVSNTIAPGSGAVVGAGLMGGSAAGNAYTEFLNQGYEKGQARTYSTLVGVSEAGLSYAFGGISKLGGKLTGKTINAIANGVDNALGRFAIKYGLNMASEGFEEAAQEILNPFFENLALGYTKNDFSDVEWGEVAYSGVLGALSAGFLEGGTTAVSTFGENAKAKKTGANIRNNERINEMLDIADMTPQESDAYNLYTKYAKKGVNADNVSDLQLGRLHDMTNNQAMETLSSKKTSVEQKAEAFKTLGKLSKVNTENTDAKRKKELSIGESTEVTSTGNSVAIEGIKLGKDNTTLITTEGEVSVNDITLSDKDAELVVRAEHIGKVYSEEMGNLFLSQYDGETNIDEYTDSFNLVRYYSEQEDAYFQDKAIENRGVLTPQQVGAIYTATRQEVAKKQSEVARETAQAQQKEIDTLTAKWGKTMTIQGEFDDSIIDYNSTTTDGSKVNWDRLTDDQRDAIKFAKLFSKATGVNIRFIKSEVATEGKNKDKHVGKNGSYDPTTNTIEIDVFAGRIEADTANDSIIPTLSHEVTHWMKYKMPALYNSIREEVLKTLSNKGSIDERIGTEINRMKNIHPNKEVTSEDAIDELVSRACEDMLSNSNATRKLLAKMSASEQQSFIEKVKETFDNLIKWINDLLAHYKSNSEEAKILREYKQQLKKISKQWDKMLISSISANQALKKEGITGEELAKSADKNVKHSHRDVEKGKKRYYNELNSLAMQWAYSASTNVGDTKIFNDRGKSFVVLEATEDGYIEIARGSYEEVKELEQIYNAENEGFDRYAETYKSIKGTSDSGLWESPNREMFGRNSRATNPTQEGTKGNTSTENAGYVFSNNKKTSTETKRSDRDTLGNTLTEAQQSYFAESKVRDENGNLKVVYHGTRNADFTVFKRNATYFTDNKSMADSYSPNGEMFEGYVNITKPYEIDAKGEKWSMLPIDEDTANFLKEYGASVFKEKGKWRTTPADIASAIEEAVDNGELDYDGIIIKNIDDTGSYYKGKETHLATDYIVFNSNQFKNASNKNPTADKDIRFSDREERYQELQTEYNQLEKEAEALKQSEEYLNFIDSISLLQGEELDKAVKEYGEWTHKSGLYDKSKRMSEIIGEQKDIRAALDNEKELSRDAYMKSIENLTEKEKMDFVNKAVKRFGTTNRLSLASYLMLNGKMLDFSEGQGYRVQDHREISEILDMPETTGYSDGLIAFMNMGNIRLQTYGIDISQAPNQAQKSALRDIISQIMRNEDEFNVDFSKTNGYTDGSVTYPKGTASSKILADIDSYFETGVVPEYESSISEFLYSDRDTEGNKLSKEQQDFFANSKVRDSEGNLLVCYHGTDAEFTVFDKSKIGFSNGAFYGNGFYFSDSKSAATQYGNNIYEYYLNITNPLYLDDDNWVYNLGLEKKKEPLKVIETALEETKKGFYTVHYKDSSSPNTWKSLDRVTKSQLDEYGVSGFVERRINPKPSILPRDVKDIAYLAQKKGYDGIIGNGTNITDFGTVEYVVFNENQIKSTSNTNPTSNPDIRYSDRDNVSVYDTMGETDRLIKENEQLKEDVERLKERLKLERQITNGNHFNENQLNTVAAHIRNIAKSNYSKTDLVNLLKGVYSYIATSKELNWDDLFSQAYDVASMVLSEARPVTETNEYYKWILNDIRGTKISVNEQQIQNARYKLGNRWRNSFFNKVKITDNAISLDRQWQEWSAAYPDLFDAEISDADMLVELYDIYDSVREGSELVVEYDTEEQTRWLAREIYNQYWNVSPIRTTAEKYTKQIKLLNYKHREAMNQLRNNYEDRLKSQHKADRQKAIKLVKEIRERKDKEIAEVKKHSKERMDAYKDNAARKTKIQSITAKALSLNEWLIKNSKEKHIHESLKAPVANLLQAIDFSSQQLLGMRGGKNKGMPTQKDISLQKALSQVKDMMLEASVGKEELIDLYGHDLDDDIKLLVESVDNIMRKVGDNEFILNQMTLNDLNTLDNMLKTIKQAVTKMNQFHSVHHAQGIASLGQEEIRYAEKLGNEKVYVEGSKKAGIKKMLKWTNSVPYYAFKRFGEAGKKIFEAFQDGWDKLSFNVKEVIDFTKKTYTSKEVKAWEKEIKSFDVLVPATDSEKSDPNYKPKSQKVQMTTAQVMHLYLLNKRAAAKPHLLGEGIKVADIETKKSEVISQPDDVKFEQGEIDKIIQSLNKRQIEVANALSKFMNTVCSDWGNEVSMARFGYKAFGEPNYVPMNVDKDGISTPDPSEKNNSLFKLLNMSFTKGLTEGAKNTLVISSIFDVFAQHTSDMAKYNALALPVLDAFKWYNYKEIEYVGEEARVRKTVKKSIGKAFGKDGQNYITTLLEDINGQKNVSRDTLGNGFFKNAKIASVGMNLRVILLQPTSYFRASANIDNKYLIKALAHKPKIAHAEKYCGMALWKSLGYYDTNIQRGVAEQIKHADKPYDKLVEWSMKGAGEADRLTLGYLWNAAELEIRKTRKDLKVGSEEFFFEVGKRLRDIIYSTQVVDSTLTRSGLMRSPDGRDKMLSAFASEPTLAYNMVQDAFVSASLEKKANGKMSKESVKKIARVMVAYTMTNAVAALIESGFEAFRDEEDEEMDIVEFMKLYLSNFFFDMSFTAKIPYIKEFVSILQGFTSSRIDTQWMQSLGYALKGWQKVAMGEGNPITAIKNSLRSLAYLSGLPFYNAYRDIMATLYKLDILSPEDIEEIFE